MRTELKKAMGEVALAAAAGSVFYLFAAAVFAVAVRAGDPPQAVVTGVNWTLKALGAFVFCMLFVKKERALFKGMAGGAAMSLLSLLLFAAIGGGFRATPLFLLELALSALFGGLGALLGVKLRKEG